MIYLFYSLTFLVSISAVLLHLSIYKYFHQKMLSIQWKKNKIKYFNIASTVFGVLPIILLFPFLLYFNSILFICFASSMIIFIGILTYIDYQIYRQKKGHVVWWQKLTNFDKILVGLMGIILVTTCYLNTSPRSIFILICFNTVFVYVLFIKTIKGQHKIVRLSTNRYLRIFEVFISNLFYYICWFIIGIYIISMGLNVTGLYFDPYDIDGCLDIGICKEGLIFDKCTDKDMCTITKENCLKNNNVWIEDIRSCDTRRTAQ